MPRAFRDVTREVQAALMAAADVANDFGYNPDVARNVIADVRYLLWLLEEVEGATQLVRELGVPPRRAVSATRRAPAGSARSGPR